MASLGVGIQGNLHIKLFLFGKAVKNFSLGTMFALSFKTCSRINMEIAALIFSLFVFFGVAKLFKEPKANKKNSDTHCHSIKNIRYKMLDKEA